MNNTLIPNTIMTPYSDGGYDIAPVEGYVLHDKRRGWEEEDPITGETVFRRAYCRGSVSCFPNYDFTTSQITIENGTTVTAYGAREFFAIPESEAPTNQIFGGGNNDHETI